MNRQRGVTLVELMVTIAVLFVIGAISIPAYTRYVQTAREETLLARAESFRIYAANYRIDNGTFLAGTYDPVNGINDFDVEMGFRVDEDKSGIAFVVGPGVCGTISDCYEMILTDPHGNMLTWSPTGWAFTLP